MLSHMPIQTGLFSSTVMALLTWSKYTKINIVLLYNLSVYFSLQLNTCKVKRFYDNITFTFLAHFDNWKQSIPGMKSTQAMHSSCPNTSVFPGLGKKLCHQRQRTFTKKLKIWNCNCSTLNFLELTGLYYGWEGSYLRNQPTRSGAGKGLTYPLANGVRPQLAGQASI